MFHAVLAAVSVAVEFPVYALLPEIMQGLHYRHFFGNSGIIHRRRYHMYSVVNMYDIRLLSPDDLFDPAESLYRKETV